MFRSLRFRLPALFLAGVILSGLIASAIALELFQGYVLSRSKADLRRESAGLTRLYADQVVRTNGIAPLFSGRALERATGDRIYYVGPPPFPGEESGLRPLPQNIVDWKRGKPITFEFRPPGSTSVYLAVANPLRLGGAGPPFGALIVAKPKTELDQRLATLIERLALAFAGGILIAGALGWYLSRRITSPVLALSRAADQVARGTYGVEIPASTGRDEISHLADRFREMAVRLAEAEELERNFLMTVSHELRTPLTAIRGHVEALREGVANEPESREASLSVIAAETMRLERLVGDVLDLAKLEAHRFTVLREEVDMQRLCDRAFSTFTEEARRRSIVYRQDSRGKPVILTDGDRVLQIITNLLANAFRWTPDGGRIDLELQGQNGLVHVSVADTGPGISPEERERIFRPFWTRDGGGTGLGLAIARELAVALGGQIELESKPGAGSRFQLVLPTDLS